MTLNSNQILCRKLLKILVFASYNDIFLLLFSFFEKIVALFWRIYDINMEP
jgi:hypothetical protein